MGSRGASKTSVTLPAPVPVSLSAPTTKGLHIVEVELLEGEKVRAIYTLALDSG